jgi:hypothetical protein
MEGTARTWFTPKQKAELWERWRSGECIADIARALERRNKSGVYRILTLNGGIAPELRRRAREPTRAALIRFHRTVRRAPPTPLNRWLRNRS